MTCAEPSACCDWAARVNSNRFYPVDALSYCLIQPSLFFDAGDAMHHIKRSLNLPPSCQPTVSPTDSRNSSSASKTSTSSNPSTSKSARRYSDLQSIPQDIPVDFSAPNSPSQSPEPLVPNLQDLAARKNRLSLSKRFTRHTTSHSRNSSTNTSSAASFHSAVTGRERTNSSPPPPSPKPPHRLTKPFNRRTRSETFVYQHRTLSPPSNHPNHTREPTSTTSLRSNPSPQPTSSIRSLKTTKKKPKRPSNRRTSSNSLFSLLLLGRPSNPSPPSIFSTLSCNSSFVGPRPADPQLLREFRKQTLRQRILAMARTVATTRTTRAPRRSLMSRITGTRKSPRTKVVAPRAAGTTTTTTTTTKRTTHHGGARAPVVHHQKRKTTMADKISGALTKLKGSLTGRPGVKAAGTRRMHGTDGRRRRV